MSSAKPALLIQPATFDLIELLQLRDDYGFATDTPDSAPGWHMSSILHGLGAEPGMSSAKPALLIQPATFD